jgi:hypothetical protein
VAGIRAVAFADALAVSVDLAEGDQFGEYRYYVHFDTPGRSLCIRLEPHRQVADVSYTTSSWTDVGTVSGDLFRRTDTSATALIPYEYFSSIFGPALLADAVVSLHIDFLAGDRREGFGFPGTGTVWQDPGKGLQ